MSAESERRPSSTLVEAAQALQEELERLAAISREAQRLPLSSRKNLERTAERLGELARADERIGPLVQRLLAAVSDVAGRQGADAEKLHARAEELQRRRATYLELVERYTALGRGAQDLNRRLQGLPRLSDREAAQALDVTALEAVRAEVTLLAGGARAMAEAARAADFEELAVDAEAVRQALLAAKNRLNLLAERAGDRAVGPIDGRC
jgi:hypothetical protein